MLTNEKLNDEDILERSLRNPKYFELLVLRYQKAFLRKSISVIHSKEEAEDIVQETFLKIYKNGKNFKEQDGASFKSWAYTILRNTCYSYYKRQKRQASHVRLVDWSEYDVPDMNLEETDDSGKKSYVEGILSLMPESLAHILRLYFLEEKSQKEIALIENISAGAVRVRIHRAKNFFKKLSLSNI